MHPVGVCFAAMAFNNHDQQRSTNSNRGRGRAIGYAAVAVFFVALVTIALVQRATINKIGFGPLSVDFGHGSSGSPSPTSNPTSSGPSSPGTASQAITATPTSTTRPSTSIAIQDPHATNIGYIHDVPGKMTGFKPGEEAVWILAIIRGDPKLYPQGPCDITGDESFKCPRVQFGDPGGKGTFYGRAIIVNAVQQSVLEQYKKSGNGLTSMPKVVAKSDLVRYTR